MSQHQSGLRPFSETGAAGRKSARGLEGDFVRESRSAIIALFLTWLCASEAHAQPITQEAGAALAKPPVPTSSYPKPGGHVGVAIPVAVVGSDSEIIFHDFFDLGLVSGITVHLSEAWAVDFEFVVNDRLKSQYGPPTMVVEPGVIAKLESFNAGLRVAMGVAGETTNNIGLIPFVNKGFAISDQVSWLVELYLPVFFSDAPTNKVTLTPTLQTGVGF
jgi:hypothetical protein